MKKVNATDQRSLEELLLQAPDEDVIVLRDGHAVALLVPFDDEDLEWYARERDAGFIQSISRARQQSANKQTITHQKLKKELGLS